MTDADDTSTSSDSPLESVSWRRVASVLGVLILVAVLIPFVIFAVPQTVGADQSYVVTSGSMEPSVSVASAIVVKDVDPARIEENDIITFGSDEQTTTHRVIEVVDQDGERAFRTKGDNNEDADAGLVTPGQIEGRVMTVAGEPFAIPYIGYLVQFTKTQTGFTLLVFVPFVLLVLNEVWNVVSSATPDSSSGGDGDTATAEPAAAGDGTETVEPAATSAHEPVETGTGTDDDEGITLLARELKLGIAISGAFLAYSVWVSYVTTEFWAFGTTAAVATAFLLLSGLYLSGRSGSDEDPAGGSGSGSDRGSEPTTADAADEPAGGSATEASVDVDNFEDDSDPVNVVEMDTSSEKIGEGAESRTGDSGFVFLDKAVEVGGAGTDDGEEGSVEDRDVDVTVDGATTDGGDDLTNSEE